MEDFVGAMKLFAGNFAPKGYMDCDGRLLSVNENTPLFAILGTQYGGDGFRTFALPDLRPLSSDNVRQPWNDQPRWIICVQGFYPTRD